MTSNNGSITAGVFTRYNGVELTSSDHYLIEERGPTTITISQPFGADIPLMVNKLPSWTSDALIYVLAYGVDGEVVSNVPATIGGSTVSFTYQQEISDQDVACYRILQLLNTIFLPIAAKI